GSSRVEAWGSSSVVAWGSSSVEAWGSSRVEAGKYVPVQIPAGQKPKVKGSIIIRIAPIKTAREWCDYYGVKVERGVAVVFKALKKDLTSPPGLSYKPDTKPTAPD